MRIKALVVAAAFALAVATPTAALAGTIVGSAADPLDQLPALSGSATPDVTNVAVGYDDATGTVSADVTFAAAVGTSEPYLLSVNVGTSPGYCFDGLSIFAGLSDSSGLATRSGTTGTLPATMTWNAARTVVNLRAAGPGLAGGAFGCAAASTSLHDDIGHCGTPSCDFISHTYTIDDVPQFGLVASPVSFVSSVPPAVVTPRAPTVTTPAAPPATETSTTRLVVRAKAYKCLGMVTLVSSTIHHPEAVGRIKYILRGPKVRREYEIKASEAGVILHDFTHLAAGTYTLTSKYLGGRDTGSDKLYAPSKTVTTRLVMGRCA